MENALEEMLLKCARLFYQNKEREGYQLFGVLLEKLAVIITDSKAMETVLGQAMVALEKRDGILLADILWDDLIPLLRAEEGKE